MRAGGDFRYFLNGIGAAERESFGQRFDCAVVVAGTVAKAMTTGVEGEQGHKQEIGGGFGAGGSHSAETFGNQLVAGTPEAEREGIATAGRDGQGNIVSTTVERNKQRADVYLVTYWPEAGDDGTSGRWAVAQHVLSEKGTECGVASRAAGHGRGAGDAFGFGKIGTVRNHRGRWRDILPEPAFAGGRQNTETRIPAEPAPGGMLTGPGDELPDAPSSPAERS